MQSDPEYVSWRDGARDGSRYLDQETSSWLALMR